MILHAVAGLPRSGSTLFCNILNQHPLISATSTSALPYFVGAVSGVASSALEVKNLLDRHPEATLSRLRKATLSFCQEWHAPLGKPIVFDKGRGWARQALSFREFNPEGVIVVIVRDLRAVFGSIEKENSKSGLLQSAPDTIWDRYTVAFAQDGVVGGPLRWVMDLAETKPGNVYFIRYEDLMASPAAAMGRVYEALGIPPHEHDFENVENTAIDPDGFYLHKFPHRGCGKVEKREPEWPKWVPPRIVADIMQGGKQFNEFFKYR